MAHACLTLDCELGESVEVRKMTRCECAGNPARTSAILPARLEWPVRLFVYWLAR
jgi:hypothetical protein